MKYDGFLGPGALVKVYSYGWETGKGFEGMLIWNRNDEVISFRAKDKKSEASLKFREVLALELLTDPAIPIQGDRVRVRLKEQKNGKSEVVGTLEYDCPSSITITADDTGKTIEIQKSGVDGVEKVD